MWYSNSICSEEPQLFVMLVAGDVPLEVLTQIVATLSDPSAMLGPEV